MPSGPLPTVTVPTIALVEVLTIATVLPGVPAGPRFDTYRSVPAGFKATPLGLLNPGIVAITVFVLVSRTETVFWPAFDT